LSITREVKKKKKKSKGRRKEEQKSPKDTLYGTGKKKA